MVLCQMQKQPKQEIETTLLNVNKLVALKLNDDHLEHNSWPSALISLGNNSDTVITPQHFIISSEMSETCS